ncbi:hypothetical protein HDU93_002787 [Gonapodya sp. JEL0774]|nr:hypothetical protein HDU93_002787 [Gonapodya sp. JEL0774]
MAEPTRINGLESLERVTRQETLLRPGLGWHSHYGTPPSSRANWTEQLQSPEDYYRPPFSPPTLVAEVFGIVCGAVSIAATFSTCHKCFNYVQVGRGFDKDIQTETLNLALLSRGFDKDIQTETLNLALLKLRLSRWGEAVHIYDKGGSNFSTGSAKLLERLNF